MGSSLANSILNDVFNEAYPRWKGKATWSWDSGTVTIKDPHHDIRSFDLDTIEELRSKGITVTDLCIDDTQAPISACCFLISIVMVMSLRSCFLPIPQIGYCV